MAIADAEPKKGDAENTSTGSSSGNNKDMKKLTHGPVKYSSLKDFSFSVSDVWDDLNICIFLECCHANIAELRDHNCAEENKVWEKIAKSGLERAGSINCFNVNYCLELAKCLKNFVIKNQTKMMDNEIFKILYDNVVDLLPHFEPSSAKVPRRRSGSQDKHNKLLEHSKHTAPNDSPDIVVEPFKSSLDSLSALKKISTVLNKFDPADLMKSNARSAVWKEVRARTGESFGLTVNPKTFIEGYKDSVISTVQSTPGADKDPQIRNKAFLKIASDMLPYFDYIAPKAVKKSDFLLPEGGTKEPSPPKTESKKKKPEIQPETTEPAEDPPAEDPVVIPEPSCVYRKEKEPPKPDDKKQENPEETTGNQAKSDEPPAKRARRPRAIKAPEDPPKKLQPTRLRTKRAEQSAAPVVAGEPEIENSSTPPVPVASTSATTVGPLVPASRTKIVAQERVCEPSPFRAPEPAKVDVADETSDSEIEDVPLMGNRFKVLNENKATKAKTRSAPDNNKTTPSILTRPNGNRTRPDRITPCVVRLERSAAVEMALEGSEIARPARRRPGRVPKKRPSPPREASPVRQVSTIVPRRGRPPKNPGSSTVRYQASHTKAPARPVTTATTRREPPPSTPSSSALVRPGPSRQPAHSQQPAHYSSPGLAVHCYQPPAPVNGHMTQPGEFALRPNPQDPPEWFDRFVVESRRQEMWKIHQLMKMQNELLDAEDKKRSVLEMILAALSDRNNVPTAAAAGCFACDRGSVEELNLFYSTSSY